METAQGRVHSVDVRYELARSAHDNVPTISRLDVLRQYMWRALGAKPAGAAADLNAARR